MQGKFDIRRCASGFALACLMSLVSLPSAAQPPSQKLTFVLAGAGLHYIVHYVAEAGGFFKEEGLEVETVNVPSAPRMVAAIMGGSADVAPSNVQPVIQALKQGGSMVAVSRVFDIFPMTLVLSNSALAKTGITPSMSIDEKVKRLNGLKIGITTVGSGTDLAVRSLLRTRGMDPDKTVSMQPLGTPESMLVALEKGLVDGISYPAPHVQIAEKRGLGKIVVDPLSGEVPEIRGMEYMTLITSRDILAKKRPQIASAVRAYTKAMRFVETNPKEARALVYRYFKDMDQDVFNAAFDSHQGSVPRTPVLEKERIEKLVVWMNLWEKVPFTVNVADAINNDVAIEARKTVLGR